MIRMRKKGEARAACRSAGRLATPWSTWMPFIRARWARSSRGRSSSCMCPTDWQSAWAFHDSVTGHHKLLEDGKSEEEEFCMRLKRGTRPNAGLLQQYYYIHMQFIKPSSYDPSICVCIAPPPYFAPLHSNTHGLYHSSSQGGRIKPWRSHVA